MQPAVHRPTARPRAGLAITAFLALMGCQPPVPLQTVWVEVPAGARLQEVAESLAAPGILTSAGEFERYVRARYRHWEIRPGAYQLRLRMKPAEVVWAVRRYPPMAKVVVRERMTVTELALEMGPALNLEPESVLVAARDSALRARLGARAESINGYLYPTTYYVSRYATARQVLQQMADTFEARWNPAWNPRLESLGLSRDEVVTLASIVAGEMPHPEDRFDIASVYHNRLSRGMRLQADPTVVYALGERRRLRFSDYRVASDYNTYHVSGLPPGPIGQPSTESLEAALYPSETDYLFFVGGWNGRHEFSRTYRDHLRSIAQVRGRGGDRSKGMDQ